MLKRNITYTDFEGNQRSEDFYFNFSKSELVEMELASVTKENPDGNYAKQLEKIVESHNGRAIMDVIKDMISRSYGVRSDDGRYFEKDETSRRRFLNSAAYDQLFYDLCMNPDKAGEFFNGLMPREVMAEAKKIADAKAGRPQLQDHLQKETKTVELPSDQHRVEPQVPERPAYLPAVEPVLSPEVQSVKYGIEQLQGMTPEGWSELMNRYDGWAVEHGADGITFIPPASERTISRPPHESGPGFQSS